MLKKRNENKLFQNIKKKSFRFTCKEIYAKGKQEKKQKRINK
jgi:hypothetical protein